MYVHEEGMMHHRTTMHTVQYTTGSQAHRPQGVPRIAYLGI